MAVDSPVVLQKENIEEPGYYCGNFCHVQGKRLQRVVPPEVFRAPEAYPKGLRNKKLGNYLNYWEIQGVVAFTVVSHITKEMF